MERVSTSRLQQALDVVEKLPPEDQETLVELIQRRLVERRRDEIARNAAATLQAVREGRAQYGSVEDLKRDLLGEP
ncbi:MAG: hypothetical protein ACRDGG_04380 [Anaerolineae bacterium]